MNTRAKRSPSRRAGFTLVELSVVLVIISLLVGAIVAGTSLVRAARVKSVTSDKEAYQNAMLAFRDKYNALPGDMANATDIWGYATGVAGPITVAKDNACAQLLTYSTNKATCNGNGNDRIYERTGAGYFGHEQYRVWQHLSNAGMIEGTYSGVIDCNSSTAICAAPGVNTPVSSMPDATWYIADPNGEPPGSPWFDLLWTNRIEKHLLYFGGTIVSNYRTANSNPFQSILTPAEAWAIDDKYDDGFPGRGRVRVISPDPGNPFTASPQLCATTANSTTAVYNLTKTTLECS
ncbi:MAG: type II secretion system protein, partial [Alphaproteobacteria bacterium]|nr:type II secretion system protein [Alphaproteobacteria bacterium]